MLLAAFVAIALAAPPPTIDLTADELASLAAGDIVVRAPTGSTSGELIGVVDIAAPFESTWNAIFDWDARKRSVDAIEDITVYAPQSDPDGLGVTFTLSILRTEIVYHLRYTSSHDEGWTTFKLDPTKENDIVASNGSYYIERLDASHQRIHYRAFTDTGRSVPGFVRNYVATSSIRSQLEAMRSAATGH